jgi:hypothetical protein
MILKAVGSVADGFEFHGPSDSQLAWRNVAMRGFSGSLVSVLLAAATFACASASGSSSTASPAGSTQSTSDFITTTEIESAAFRDAYDVVQRLRPTWFTKARAAGSSGSIGGTQVGGGNMAVQSSNSVGLVVYLDNTRMGGPQTLRDISASSIKSLQYLDAAAATARLPGLGSSIVSGAIVATSRAGH